MENLIFGVDLVFPERKEGLLKRTAGLRAK
jgi:hypothetical protein